MKRWLALLAGATFLFVAIPADEAEAQVAFGPQLILFDLDELGIGARVDIGLGDTFGIEEGVFQNLFASLRGSYLVDSPDGLTELVFDFNAAVPFDADMAFTPYAGAGINHYRVSNGGSISFSGLNLLGGLEFDIGIPAFLELQYSTTSVGYLSLSAGVLFGR